MTLSLIEVDNCRLVYPRFWPLNPNYGDGYGLAGRRAAVDGGATYVRMRRRYSCLTSMQAAAAPPTSSANEEIGSGSKKLFTDKGYVE
ncbi:hypothetical protein J6590_061852 [Homalodisca vitripennis]|nr:hypothetical protein J6590_061852 [Homalodisca vitripennis]